MITIIFCLIIGSFAFIYGFKFVKLYFTVKGWTKTEAVVISKKVELNEKSTSVRTPYGVKVQYTYSFNNVEYVNNKVYLVELIKGMAGFRQPVAQQVVDKIPSHIKVYVNPKNPQESVMYCNDVWLYFVMIIMGFICFIIVLVNLINMFGKT